MTTKKILKKILQLVLLPITTIIGILQLIMLIVILSSFWLTIGIFYLPLFILSKLMEVLNKYGNT